MLLPDRSPGPRLASSLAALFVAAGLAAGCTVQPLHGNSGTLSLASTDSAQQGLLASIDVAEVDTRQAQQVRNHLIFLFGGGQGQPADPDYSLTMRVSVSHTSAASVQVGVDDEPTSGMVTVSVTYSLVDNETRQTVGRGTKSVLAAYDRPRQEFAGLRARRNAEDRAAREVAEQIRMAVAQDLARPRDLSAQVERDDRLPVELLPDEEVF
jgi:LPS-assembly lipoprotein